VLLFEHRHLGATVWALIVWAQGHVGAAVCMLDIWSPSHDTAVSRVRKLL